LERQLSLSDGRERWRSTDQPLIFDGSRRSSLSIGEMGYTAENDQLTEETTEQDLLLPRPQDSSQDAIPNPQLRVPDDDAQLSAPQPREPHGDADDMESIFSDIAFSDTTTIDSEASRANDFESNALHVLAEYLAGLKELAPLLKIALDKMKKDRFTNNLRRILESFYLQLQREASSEQERMIVHLFRRHRTRLARNIVHKAQSRGDESDHEARLDYRQTPNEWLARLPSEGANHQLHNEPVL
jgi:hypothetical protein